MTQKIIKAYSSLRSWQKRVLLLTAMLLLVIGSVAGAMAATDIRFSGQSPASGTVVGSVYPQVGLTVAVTSGTVDTGDVQMSIDNNQVSPIVKPGSAAGLFSISATPPTGLTEGEHNIAVSVNDNTLNIVKTSTWSFSVDAAPKAAAISPADASIAGNANPTISVNIKDTFDKINGDSRKLFIDGVPVQPAWTFAGKTMIDSCGYSYYVISSYKEGTLTYQTSKLSDGLHTATVTIADIQGNLLTKTWNFTVASKPTFSGYTPANGSLSAILGKVTAKVTDDNGAINPSKISLKVNNSAVPFTFDSATGTITYNNSFSEGSYSVDVSAEDTAGNAGTASWSFTVSGGALPQVTSLTPADGAKVLTAATEINAYVTDSYYNLNESSRVLKIDGTAVGPTIWVYKGHWVQDSCAGSIYIVDSYKEGTLSYKANLKDGLHTAELIMSDTSGVVDKTWSFTVASSPTFSGYTPANGSSNKTVTGLSVKVADDNADIDPNSIFFTINGNRAQGTWDASNKVASVVYGFPDTTYNISVSAADTSGNTGTAKWSFVVINQGPKISVLTLNTTKITDGMLNFSGKLTDPIDIDPTVNLQLDGNTIPVDFRYDGITDTCGTYVIRSKKLAYLTAKQVISDGTHTLSVTTKDIIGNVTTQTWNLYVETHPTITGWTPVTFLSNLTPPVSATLKDVNTGIDPATIQMTLDGQAVSPKYDSSSGLVSYTPPQLANESYHTVALSVYDTNPTEPARSQQPLKTNITWKFYTNTYPDMSDSNISNCAVCHKGSDLQSVHPKGTFGGDHGDEYRCNDCHSHITQGTCGLCHDPNIGDDPATPHGTTQNIKYNLINTNPYTPYRVTQNREMWDCGICHQPGNDLLFRYYGRSVKNHDLPELHKTTASSCSQCHAQSLTHEHARPGRVDNKGQAITCLTCHQSSNPNVQNAIATHNKNCTACHTSADHQSIHTDGLDVKCQTCHKPYLTEEHLDNTTTAGKGFDCTTCHESNRNEVKRSIAAGNLNCAGCHQVAHQIKLVDNVPKDIPLLTSFNWTNPIDASIYNNGPTTPAGYGNGWVVISNRHSDVTSDKVWSDINTLLADNQWKLVSTPPAAGASSFTAEFTKDYRGVFIKCYSSLNSDGSGAQLGYRIEVWYK